MMIVRIEAGAGTDTTCRRVSLWMNEVDSRSAMSNERLAARKHRQHGNNAQRVSFVGVVV